MLQDLEKTEKLQLAKQIEMDQKLRDEDQKLKQNDQQLIENDH